MSDVLAGDPFHESGSQPMTSLKGSMEMPNTQQPMQSTNSGDTDGNTVTPSVAGWKNTVLGEKPAPTGSNDKNKAH